MSHGVDAFAPVLKALSEDPAIEFGRPGARVEVLGSVDGQFSSVRRIRIDSPAGSVHAYAKILKPYNDSADELARADRMLQREYNATSALYSALRQDAEIGAVRPIALLPEHRALVTEEVPGQPFSELLAESPRATDALVAIAKRIGAWTRIYQSLGGDQAGAIALSERRRYLDDRLALLEGRVMSKEERARLLQQFDALAAQLGVAEVPAVAIHADLTPMNIIVDGNGRVAVLDFTMAKSGTAFHDLSHVYFHLELMGARQHKREMMRELQGALLSGYSPALSEEDPLFRLMLLQHAVCHLALLSARRLPVIDVAYRWFLRRRWRACERMFRRVASPLRITASRS